MNWKRSAGLLLCGALIGATASIAQETPKPVAASETKVSNKPYTVAVWGDSIAAGGSMKWPDIAERMCNLVLNTGRPVRVVNLGIGGLPAAVARSQYAEKIAANTPDMVIIQFGFNDMRYDGSRGNRPLSTPEEFEKHITEMVTRCRDEAHARVILFGNHKAAANLMMPTGLTYDETRAEYSAVLKKVAAQTKVAYYDLSQELKVEGYSWKDFLSDDGIHLSPVGFNAYGRFAANIIAGTVK